MAPSGMPSPMVAPCFLGIVAVAPALVAAAWSRPAVRARRASAARWPRATARSRSSCRVLMSWYWRYMAGSLRGLRVTGWWCSACQVRALRRIVRAVGDTYTAAPGNWPSASRPVRPPGGVYTGWKCQVAREEVARNGDSRSALTGAGRGWRGVPGAGPACSPGSGYPDRSPAGSQGGRPLGRPPHGWPSRQRQSRSTPSVQRPGTATVTAGALPLARLTQWPPTGR
jgi:hypothetical protein